MNIQRIAIALLWLVTVVAAYFIGGSNETNPGSPASNTASAQAGSEGNSGRGPREVVRKLDGSEDDPGRREKANIPMLIAKARVEMGTGMGGMMNMRGMLRAITPIIERRLREATRHRQRRTRTFGEIFLPVNDKQNSFRVIPYGIEVF